MLLQSIFAFCAIIGFSVLIEAPKRCLVVNGILGMAGWAIYLYTEKYTSMLMATFMSGLVLAIISHILARIMKNAGHDHTYTGNTYDSAGSRNV